jgi:hypothetical protein
MIVPAQILYYGSQLGKNESGKSPTYVFPIDLHQEVRNRFKENASGSRDQEFEGNPETFVVTWDHLLTAKWPNPPKACNLCKSGRSKPY